MADNTNFYNKKSVYENRIEPIVGGLHIPVYCIGYNMNNTKELKELAEINEAALINADSDDIVNQLRNLFNVNM